jgi:quercetin dioxygenase-like cupin family protein
MEKILYHMPKLEKKQIDENLRSHKINGKEMSIVYSEFKKGAVHENLKHFNEEFFYLVSGEMNAHIDNQSFNLKSGDGLLISSNTLHGFFAIETSIALITFAPPMTMNITNNILKDPKQPINSGK